MLAERELSSTKQVPATFLAACSSLRLEMISSRELWNSLSLLKQDDQHVSGSGLEEGGDGGDGGDGGGEDPGEPGLEPVVTLYLRLATVKSLSGLRLTCLTSQLAAPPALLHSRRHSSRPPGGCPGYPRGRENHRGSSSYRNGALSLLTTTSLSLS